MISRRAHLKSLFLLALSPASSRAVSRISVFKDTSCACCSVWIEHLKQNGFDVVLNEVPDAQLRETKSRYGVPPDLQTCHTAIVEGYVVEGHVPATDIQRLLKERPKAAGLAVPGMPIGSPGMEGPNHESYSVLLFDGPRTTVFQAYPAE
jgi:hypothetical protein